MSGDGSPSGGIDDIDPTVAHDAADLSRCLQELWVRAGRRPLRQVDNDTSVRGGELPYSKTKLHRVPIRRSTLAEVLNKGKFPTLEFLLTFVEYCGVDLAKDQRWDWTWGRIALLEHEQDHSGSRVDPHVAVQDEARPGRRMSHDQADAPTPKTMDVAFVSCDVIGHSLNSLEMQVRNVLAINNLVADVMNSVDGTEDIIFWVSGGDGGHVVFAGDNWKEFAWRLIVELRTWSARENVPLRVTAHYGPVVSVTGADGRVQFVGDSINIADWILNVGSGGGVVVSDAFRWAFEGAPPSFDTVVFHEKRTLRSKSDTPQELWLASSESDRSHWGLPTAKDRVLLTQALTERNKDDHEDGWRILYAAKRILQVNPDDVEAIDAIHQLSPTSLTYTTSEAKPTIVTNPFLGHLESATLREVVQAGELIERRSNEIICRYGERGETMFVILHGQVGVYKSEGKGSSNPAKPAFVMSEGEIIGELAFTLGHTRTADLVTLSDTALLSFNMAHIMKRLPDDPQGQLARTVVRNFIDSRVLEHISDNTTYLLDTVDNKRSGPLAAGYKSWRGALLALATECRLVTLDPSDLQINLDRVVSAIADDRRSADEVRGIFILASGKIRTAEETERLDDSPFPIIWVNIPGIPVRDGFTYTVIDGPVKVLYIAASAIGGLESAKRAALYKAIQETNIYKTA